MNSGINNSFRAIATRARAILCVAAVSVTALLLVTDSNAAADRTANIASRPLSFEKNVGQYDNSARFVSRGPAYHLTLAPTEVFVTVRKSDRADTNANALPHSIRRDVTSIRYRTLRIELIGSNADARMSGVGELSGQANYLIGSDASRWRTGVPAYDRVRATDVYPGINLIHYGNAQHLEYDFEIAPDANPDLIAMRFTGADKVELNSQGELVLQLGDEMLHQPKPVIYQTVAGQRMEIRGGYVLSNVNTVKFWLGDYDRSLPLVIDPIVSFSVLQGGDSDDTLYAIALDGEGNVYVSGETLSVNLATTGAFQTNLAGTFFGHGDVLIQKFPNTNSNFAKTYTTYLGGSADESAFALAVDAAGNAYVAGYTGSTNFPTRNPTQTNLAGVNIPGIGRPPVDAFVAKLDPRGTNLIFSTFFGGTRDDAAGGIALDSAGNITVVGYTLSTNFPVVNIPHTTNTVGTNVVITTNSLAGSEDAFVFKLSADGTNILYSRYLGGAGRDYATGVANRSDDHTAVVGYTSSSAFPITTNAAQSSFNNTTNTSVAFDSFITIIAPTNGHIAYSTYLGGTNDDFAFKIARDSSNNLYAVGSTRSSDFPRSNTNLYSSVITNAAFADAFATKLSSSLTNWDYSVTFGGSAKDEAWDIAVDSPGRAHVVGATLSGNFPVTNVFGLLRSTNSGDADAFIAELNSNATALNYSAQIGTSSTDEAHAVAVDAGGNTYFAGIAGRTTFPTLPSVGNLNETDRDGFILKILAEPTLEIASSGTNVVLKWPGFAPEFTVQTRTNLLSTNWTTASASSVELTNNQTIVRLPATNSQRFFQLRK
jgi:hypothetical protein